MSPLQSRAARAQGRRREYIRSRPWFFAALTFATAVALGLLVWFAATSVAWFVAAPTGDPLFGALNRCLLDLGQGARAGFSVAPDGRAAAVHSGTGVVHCQLQGPDEPALGRWLEVPAVTEVAFDFGGTLWLSSSGAGEHLPGLYRVLGQGAPIRVGDAVAVALAGHAGGVVALDAAGRLYSVGEGGEGLGFAELGRPAPAGARLAVDAAGELVSAVGAGGVWIFTAQDLRRLFAESPCEVELLWWLPAPGQALLSCGPGGALALTLDAHAGRREAAPPGPRERSVLVPGLGAYAGACDLLPCEARSP